MERNPKGKKKRKEKKNLLLYDPFCPQGEISESCKLVIDGLRLPEESFLSRLAVFFCFFCDEALYVNLVRKKKRGGGQSKRKEVWIRVMRGRDGETVKCLNRSHLSFPDVGVEIRQKLQAAPPPLLLLLAPSSCYSRLISAVVIGHEAHWLHCVYTPMSKNCRNRQEETEDKLLYHSLLLPRGNNSWMSLKEGEPNRE